MEHCPGKDFPPGRVRRRERRLRIGENRAPPGRGQGRIQFYGSSNVPLQLGKEAQRLGTDAASRKMLSGFREAAFDAQPCSAATCPSVVRSEEKTSELQSLMRISYAVLCLKKNTVAHKELTTQTNH